MASLVTDQFRIFSAKQFINSLSVPLGVSDATAGTQRQKMYVFVGRSKDWNFERFAGVANDQNPPVPEDSFNDLCEIYDDMIAMKRITSSDVRQVIKRRTWKSGKIYDMYKHNYSSSNPASNGATKLYDSDFYVMNSQYQVFKCIYNGQTPENITGIATSVNGEPVASAGQTSIITTPDGYRWKFMYQLSIDEVLKFVSSDFIPVSSDASVVSAAIDGSIDTIIINSRGASLSPGTFYAKIVGDGSNGVVRIVVDNTGIYSGKISTATIQVAGSAYTYGKIDLAQTFSDIACTVPSSIGVSSNGTTYIEPIITPTGGHGANPEFELGGYRVMINSKLEFLDGSGDIPVDMQFRRFGLIANPTEYNSTTQSVDSTRSACKAIKFSDSFNSNFTVGETIIQATTNARGVVIHWDSINKVLRYYQNEYSGLHQNRLVAFSGANAITGQTSNTVGVPLTSYTSETNGAPTLLTGIRFTSGYAVEEIKKYSGSIVYYENRKPIVRSSDQIEDIKLVVEF
jgi:hypothetical protein